jgi:ADP-ribose pyrophosphatase YjhB (NUDIX family)
VLSDPGYRFCPKCGASLTARKLKAFEPERLVCDGCGFVLYLNPKVAAGTIVEFGGGIVLLRREIEPRRGFWVHPGGFVDRGETLEAAARRETREEVGLEVEVQDPVGAYSFADSEVVVVIFAAKVLSGTPIVGDESLEVATFTPEAIPWDDIAFPSTTLALRDYLENASHRRAFRGVSTRATEKAEKAIAREIDQRLLPLLEARAEAFASKDVRAASLVYPPLIGLLREGRRYREALGFAEEGVALTHDPLIARLADEVAHELASAEQERC